MVVKKVEKPVAPKKKPAASPAKVAPSAKAATGKSGANPNRPRCGLCGHWSIATEYGVDDRSGYCDRWEKLTDREYLCDEFVSREKFQAMQQELAEQHEDYLDEDTG